SEAKVASLTGAARTGRRATAGNGAFLVVGAGVAPVLANVDLPAVGLTVPAAPAGLVNIALPAVSLAASAVPAGLVTVGLPVVGLATAGLGVVPLAVDDPGANVGAGLTRKAAPTVETGRVEVGPAGAVAEPVDDVGRRTGTGRVRLVAGPAPGPFTKARLAAAASDAAVLAGAGPPPTGALTNGRLTEETVVGEAGVTTLGLVGPEPGIESKAEASAPVAAAGLAARVDNAPVTGRVRRVDTGTSVGVRVETVSVVAIRLVVDLPAVSGTAAAVATGLVAVVLLADDDVADTADARRTVPTAGAAVVPLAEGALATLPAGAVREVAGVVPAGLVGVLAAAPRAPRVDDVVLVRDESGVATPIVPRRAAAKGETVDGALPPAGPGTDVLRMPLATVADAGVEVSAVRDWGVLGGLPAVLALVSTGSVTAGAVSSVFGSSVAVPAASLVSTSLVVVSTAFSIFSSSFASLVVVSATSSAFGSSVSAALLLDSSTSSDERSSTSFARASTLPMDRPAPMFSDLTSPSA
ncbi:hypothetical protein GGF37_006350, partial [Kickxella alabastrina]